MTRNHMHNNAMMNHGASASANAFVSCAQSASMQSANTACILGAMIMASIIICALLNLAVLGISIVLLVVVLLSENFQKAPRIRMTA